MPERPPIPPAVFMPAVYLDGRPYEDTELTTRPEPDDDAE
jgi:hypothetical protein